MKSLAPIAVLLLEPASAAAQAYPDEVHFSQARIGVWQTDAVTVADDRDLPLIREVRCTMHTNGVQLVTMRTGEISVDFRGVWEVDESGGEETFGPLQVSAITIGGETWEAKPFAVNALPYRFTDVPYPREPGDDIVLTVFRGYSAVHRPGEPWFKPDILAERLTRAASVDISFAVWDKGGQSKTIRHFYAPLTGLGEAMRWCQTQMTSEAALKIQPGN